MVSFRRYGVKLFQIEGDQEFTVCGDIHGQFYDLCNIFDLRGTPGVDRPYLFNGDFVDRGSWSVETVFTLIGFKLLYPKHFFLSRGNHESDVMNKVSLILLWYAKALDVWF